MEMDIDKLEAGRELDALVAAMVMGWHLAHADTEWHDRQGIHRAMAWEFRSYHHVWAPSTDIGDAWRVMEKLNEVPGLGQDVWAKFHDIISESNLHSMKSRYAAGTICRASLKAVGYK